jgi:uncharacterized protein (DUF697 family)
MARHPSWSMDEPAPRVPAGLLERLRADPWRAPETIAVAATERHGPAAAAWTGRRPAGSDRRRARRVVRTHVRWARAGGATAGLAGAFGILPDMVALAWLQSRMVVYLAAVHGYDPMLRERAADILVLNELYPDQDAAMAGLAGSGSPIARAWMDQRLSGDQALLRSLVGMAFQHGSHRVAGRAIPGFASIYGALANAHDTRDLGRRATAYYRGGR